MSPQREPSPAAAPAAAAAAAAGEAAEAVVSPNGSDQFWSCPGEPGEPGGSPPKGPPRALPRASSPSRGLAAAEEAMNDMAQAVVAVEETPAAYTKETNPFADFVVPAAAGPHEQESTPSPARSQQVQPVRLTAEQARAFALLEEGQGGPLVAGGSPPAAAANGKGLLQTLRRRSSSRLRLMGDSTMRRVESQVRKGTCPFLLMWSSAAVLLFVFLQELIFNNGSFNGRCIGTVLYPPWNDPVESRKPTIIPFGYGACESNLGFKEADSGGVDGFASSPRDNPLLGLQLAGENQRNTVSRRRCAFGSCAGDFGWPSRLVKGGEKAALKAAADSPNPRILGVLGALDSNMIRNYGEVYRVFWASTLHGGWVHLIVNLLCQTAVLFILEPVWGFWRCLLTWIVSLMSGNLLSAVFDPCTVTVGSSGALYGLLGALVPFCIENWDYMDYPWCVFFLVVVVIAVAQLTNMGGFSNVDNLAHLGGCLGGLLVGFSTLYSLRAMRKTSVSIWWAKLRLCCCGCCLSSNAKAALRARIKKHEEQMRERMKKEPADGPPFVWRCYEGCMEWVVRLAALTFLRKIIEAIFVTGLVYLWLYLLSPSFYETLKTPGRISFLGSMGCNCCRLPSSLELASDPKLSLLPPHHTIRANAGAFWCFESEYHADFFCGKLFRNGSIALSQAGRREMQRAL
ncbi:hypothetical protein Efla_002740 [Eimeria flavescens]